MQGYGEAFARIYNRRWAGFATQAAPRIRAFYETSPLETRAHSVLDVCCGTGQLALHFLDAGYSVQGLDLSGAMLIYAREQAAPYVLEGRARFFEADATDFRVESPVGLAVSTFDALNHLPNLDALRGCFSSVYGALLPGGMFVFDLNTRRGLRRWTGIHIEDTEELMLVNRGVFDETGGRAYTYISGFTKVSETGYERFEETAYNTVFALQDVRDAVLAAGLCEPRFCRLTDLSIPIPDPEQEDRIWVVTGRA